MVYHVAMADKIFRGTDFNQDGGPGDGVGFVIAAVTVFKEAQAEGSKSTQKIYFNVPHYPTLIPDH